MRNAAMRLLVLLFVAVVNGSPVSAQDSVDPFIGNSYFQSVHKPTPAAVLADGASGNDAVQQVAFVSEDVATSFAPPPVQNLAEVHVNAPASNVLAGYEHPTSAYRWQILPDGLIFREFAAGPRESRISTKVFDNHLGGIEDSQTLWGGTVGGRRGLFRFGTDDPLKPEGVQLDIEAAAIVRLNLDEDRDVDASDFRFGIPLTWGDDVWQYEFGYYHLSSHIGDEFLVRNPTFERVNYVRDAILFGVSYFPNPDLRLYGELAYAFFTAGGAEPWEFQFGFEYSKAGVTGIYGTPFVAANGHLREELDFGGDFTFQTGWLWRGESGSTLRAAINYQNGASEIYQFFDTFEEQIGVGLFYDF